MFTYLVSSMSIRGYNPMFANINNMQPNNKKLKHQKQNKKNKIFVFKFSF